MLSNENKLKSPTPFVTELKTFSGSSAVVIQENFPERKDLNGSLHSMYADRGELNFCEHFVPLLS